MNNEVLTFLNTKCNDKETFKDFIRNSEDEFGMDKKPLFMMTLDDVKDYVDFLDYLWEK